MQAVQQLMLVMLTNRSSEVPALASNRERSIGNIVQVFVDYMEWGKCTQVGGLCK